METQEFKIGILGAEICSRVVATTKTWNEGCGSCRWAFLITELTKWTRDYGRLSAYETWDSQFVRKITADIFSQQVNVPKTRKTYCKGKACKKHTQHKVTQYKAGKVRLYKRRRNVLVVKDLIRVRLRYLPKESDDTTESSPDMVVRQNPCSTRKPRPRRRLC